MSLSKSKSNGKSKSKPKPAAKSTATPDSSPTALGRQMISKGAGDDTILAATKERFGPKTATPVLFTRADLTRLRVRIKKADKS